MTGLANAAPRWNISEPFNFHHVTHTRPHHVQKLERVNPNELVSEFFALRAAQASQPELRGIRTKDIQRDSPYSATSPVRTLELPRSPHNYSQPGAAYHTAPVSPTSPPPRTSLQKLTPNSLTLYHETCSDATFEALIPTESPEPLDYAIGTWNDGVYDLASPHAVTTDDCAEWNPQVPFSMVKTELAPVEEDDETDDKRSSILASTQRPMTPNSGFRNVMSLPILYRGSDACMPTAEDFQRGWAHPMPPAEESPSGWSTGLLPMEEDVFDSLHRHCMPPAQISEPSIEDPLDDIPVRPCFSGHISAGLNDMEPFWDIASEAINCSYALGAEADSFFDWYRPSILEDDMTAPNADDLQTDATGTASESRNRTPQPASSSPGRSAAKRSSSVYSSSPPSLLPLQTFSSKQDRSLAGSTESSFSSIPEAVTPYETAESAMATRFSAVKSKEWCQPAYIVPNDFESQTVQEDYLYSQVYTSDYSQDAPFHLHNAGRIDGSTISNSPRSSGSPISKSSSQESFRHAQAGSNARRPHNAGSIGSLPELMSNKNSGERFDPAVDQLADNLNFSNPSDSPSDGQQTFSAQRRRSPILAKDAGQNIMLSKIRIAEEPVPLLPASRDRASSDVTLLAQDSSMPPPSQPVPGRRMRSGSSASSLNARGSRGTHSVFLPPHTPPTRNP